MFQKTVPIFFKKFEKELNCNEVYKDTYKGYNVFISPLFKAKIWIIGINSGTGDPKVVRSFIPNVNNEYATGHYNVANQFQKLFSSDFIDRPELLEKQSVVTNLHFIRTTRTNKNEEGYGLYNLITKKNLGRDLYNEYWSKVRQWNLELLDIIEPDLILCFGLEPFKNFFNYYSDFKCIEEEKNNGHILCEIKYKKRKLKLIKIYRSPSTINFIDSLTKLISKSLKTADI